jgi:hypothetical protein
MEEINVTSFDVHPQSADFDSPDLERTKQRAKYSEDNVQHKTSMGVFVQSSAISLFYHNALGVPMKNSIKTTNTSGSKRSFSPKKKRRKNSSPNSSEKSIEE